MPKPWASAEFLELLESFNPKVQTCERSAYVCSSYITLVRCTFTSHNGFPDSVGNCSFVDSQGELQVSYDEVAFRLFEEVISRGALPDFNGKEFKVTFEKISCQLNSRYPADNPYTCRII
jgi:hypothetical protein